MKKSLEIDGKKASKGDPKVLPKHLKNLSKNKPEKREKKEGLRVIRGRRVGCDPDAIPLQTSP